MAKSTTRRRLLIAAVAMLGVTAALVWTDSDRKAQGTPDPATQNAAGEGTPGRRPPQPGLTSSAAPLTGDRSEPSTTRDNANARPPSPPGRGESTASSAPWTRVLIADDIARAVGEVLDKPSAQGVAAARYALGLCLALPVYRSQSTSGADSGPHATARREAFDTLSRRCGTIEGREIGVAMRRTVAAGAALGLPMSMTDGLPQGLVQRIRDQPDQYAAWLAVSGLLNEWLPWEQIDPAFRQPGAAEPVMWAALCRIGLPCDSQSLLLVIPNQTGPNLRGFGCETVSELWLHASV